VVLLIPALWAVSAAPAVKGPSIYVADAADPSTVTVIGTATGSLEKTIRIRSGTAISVGVAPHGKRVYVLVVGNDEAGSAGSLVPINTATNTAGSSIGVGVDPQALTFNPNGRFAYVVDGFDAATTAPNAPGSITPINLATGSALRAIKVGTNPAGIAITPDGRTAYVPDSNALNGDPTTITPINLTTNTAETQIHLAARVIAVTLNGATAYALGPDVVTPISTATNRPGKGIALGGLPDAIALAPDGQIAWVLSLPDPGVTPGARHDTLSAINTATNAIGKVVVLSGLPVSGQFFVAITPSGADIEVLAEGSGSAPSVLVSIPAGTDVARHAIDVGVDATALAVSPNSKFAYVLTPGRDAGGPPGQSPTNTSPGTVIPVSTADNRVGKPIKAGLLASAMAVTP
jgi:DNA-binding beta-propeller fold protein YncE